MYYAVITGTKLQCVGAGWVEAVSPRRPVYQALGGVGGGIGVLSVKNRLLRGGP